MIKFQTVLGWFRINDPEWWPHSVTFLMRENDLLVAIFYHPENSQTECCSVLCINGRWSYYDYWGWYWLSVPEVRAILTHPVNAMLFLLLDWYDQLKAVLQEVPVESEW